MFQHVRATQRTSRLIIGFMAMVVLLGGCTPSHTGRDGLADGLTLAPDIDLSRYAGRWYVIANIPYFAERGNVGSYFEIEFTAPDRFTDTYVARTARFDAPLERTVLTGYVVPGTGNARWRETPLWPIYLSYLILHVDPDYRTALIGYPTRNYGWVMSRTPDMDEPTYRALLQRLAGQGYDISRFARVPQTPDQIGRPGFQ